MPIQATREHVYPMQRIGAPQKSKRQMESERAALRQFLLLKAFRLNMSQIERTTRCISFTAGLPCAPEPAYRRRSNISSVAYTILATPGQLLGAVSAPIRGIYLCWTRTLLYTKDEIDEVLDSLRSLIHNGTEEEWAIFDEKADQVKSAYYSSMLTTSDSSGDLIRYAQSVEPNQRELAQRIHSYLAAEERPLSILCWNGEEHRTNQGKRLFNIIMGVFSEQ